MTNNHRAVWGSHYDHGSGQWGFACCHSTIHGSYCTGEAGIEAALASSAQHLLSKPTTSQSLLEQHDSTADRRDMPSYSKQRLGEGEVAVDQDKLQRALKDEKRKRKGARDDEDGVASKKGKLDSGSHEVTQEELGTFAGLCSAYPLLISP